ncbi:SecY-interacting protein [Aliiglaciecola lipolytica]|uniref:Protein Syd n=1 Tax=Aliiglaciecola lipolytica E3 TaxID=1127673 RepID=K6Y9M2_9ALTE|nr:SecY-interacting protein [Aliiglaciecola lipolytica]GAC13338.1 protein syd [Aliiglaciecola lipolytica E3]
MSIVSALQSFVSEYVDYYQNNQQPLVIQYDKNWPSPCYQQNGEQDEWVNWRPILQTAPASFEHFEQALDLKMDEQLKQYYTCFWSDNLNANTERGNLQLLMPWNEEDFERLQKNLVAHVLMKRRLGQEETLFFAITDEDDFIVSVHNQSGKVMLEQVGLEPKETLAESLEEFIQQLSPRI